jgi:hypothetical protein
MYEDRRGRAACPACWLDDALTSRLEAKDAEITSLYKQIGILESRLAILLGREEVLARADVVTA